MEPRVSLITLGVSDLGRAKAFYEDLGWAGTEVEQTVFIQAGASALVLWDRAALAADSGIEDHGTDGFGGVALAHNVRERDQVDAIVATAEAAGARVTPRPPTLAILSERQTHPHRSKVVFALASVAHAVGPRSRPVGCASRSMTKSAMPRCRGTCGEGQAGLPAREQYTFGRMALRHATHTIGCVPDRGNPLAG